VFRLYVHITTNNTSNKMSDIAATTSSAPLPVISPKQMGELFRVIGEQSITTGRAVKLEGKVLSTVIQEVTLYLNTIIDIAAAAASTESPCIVTPETLKEACSQWLLNTPIQHEELMRKLLSSNRIIR
jgi:hypothetical protein